MIDRRNPRPRAACLGIAAAAAFAIATTTSRAAETAPPPASKAASADADIRATATAFTNAFNKGDAKTIAALWTDQGEYESDDGTVLRGRKEIESAFAAHFKSHPGTRSTVKIESIRFPSRDTAIEEGITSTSESGMLPASSRYRALHVREDGVWRIALCREWAAEENRMIDLEWLIGDWRGQDKGRDLSISVSRDKNGPFLVAEFTTNAAGKPTSLGTMKIGVDPASRQFMSWHFDADGGYGHGTWLRERNHWAIDSHGVQGDGAVIASVNVLSRFGEDELGWRSIDRTAGGKPQPDAPPIRLKRVLQTPGTASVSANQK